MKLAAKIVIGALGAAAAAAGVLGGRAVVRNRSLDRLERALLPEPAGLVFDESMIEGLPEPAVRYLRRAIAPGTPLASCVQVRMEGRMKPSPEAAYVDLTATETLAPLRGFVWRAKLSMNGLPVSVVDRYDAGRGEMSVAALGFVPIMSSRGPDIDRSTRGRLAAESAWVPSLHLPALGAIWEEVDTERARVTVKVDGDPIAITLRVAGDGRVRELTMLRHGDVGVPSFRLIPYGFLVEEDRSFGGYTIATRLTGGWWYGTARYDEGSASSFTVLDGRHW
jgi:hypothetical protein